MKIAYHIGAHCTDDHKLLDSLLRDQKKLADQGIIVPRPWRYRPILRETLIALSGAEATEEVQDVVLSSAMDADDAKRLFFAFDNFISVPKRAIGEDRLYPNAGEKASWLRRVFPDHEVEFFMGIRNPATFYPAMLERIEDLTPEHVLEDCDPARQRWSDVIRRMREESPDTPITVWCNEDTPLIWTDILRAMTGASPDFEFSGANDLVNELMSDDGVTRMADYLKSHPPANESQRRRIIAAFLEKFGLEDELEEELDLPGWTNDYVEMLTAAYEDDMFEVAEIPGVTLIAP
ncbi:MAG: hypothetical protein ACWA47_02765 [Brevirhabdus sp.]